jgi:hypothetical protein
MWGTVPEVLLRTSTGSEQGAACGMWLWSQQLKFHLMCDLATKNERKAFFMQTLNIFLERN